MFKKIMLTGCALVSFAGLNANVHVRHEDQEKNCDGKSFEHRKAMRTLGDGVIVTVHTNKGVFQHASKAGETETVSFNGAIEGLDFESADVTDGKAHVNNKAKRFFKSGHEKDSKLLKELQEENHWDLNFVSNKSTGRNYINVKASKN